MTGFASLATQGHFEGGFPPAMGGLCRYTRASRGTSVVTSALHAPPSTSTTRIGTTGTRWTFGSGRVVSLDRSARAWSSPVGADSAIRTCCPPYVRPPTPVGAKCWAPGVDYLRWVDNSDRLRGEFVRRSMEWSSQAGDGWDSRCGHTSFTGQLAARGIFGHDNVRHAGNDVVEEGCVLLSRISMDVGDRVRGLAHSWRRPAHHPGRPR